MRGKFGLIYNIVIFAVLMIAGTISMIALKRNADSIRNASETGDSSETLVIPDWEIFRGAPGLTGISDSKLSLPLRLLWKFETGGAVKSSAVVRNGRVFIGSDDGKLYAINAGDGGKIWEFVTEGNIEAPPAVVGSLVVFGSSDYNLYAVDTVSGELKWKFKAEGKITGSANIVRTGSGQFRIVFGCYDNHLYCIDMNGQEVWRYEAGSYINGAPAVADGMIAFGSCDALVHVISGETGSRISTVDAGAYVAGSPAIADGRIYVGHYDGEFLCADAVSGDVIWRYGNGETNFFSSPTVDSSGVIFGGRDGNLYCLSRENGEEKWLFHARDSIDSSAVIADGKVVVGSDDGRLYVIDRANGRELWSYEIGDAVVSSPIVVGGLVIVGCDDGFVYAFAGK